MAWVFETLKYLIYTWNWNFFFFLSFFLWNIAMETCSLCWKISDWECSSVTNFLQDIIVSASTKLYFWQQTNVMCWVGMRGSTVRLVWAKGRNVRMTGSGVTGKLQSYLWHRFGLGEWIIPCRNIREHHESSAGGRKENNAARGASGGWEGATCSQVFGDWPHSAAMEVWVGGTTSRPADVGWCWEFLQSPDVWGTCWDHPIVPDPAAWEMEGKSTGKGGWLSHHNLLCSFPSQRQCLCAPTWTNLSEVYAVVSAPCSVLNWR